MPVVARTGSRRYPPGAGHSPGGQPHSDAQMPRRLSQTPTNFAAQPISSTGAHYGRLREPNTARAGVRANAPGHARDPSNNGPIRRAATKHRPTAPVGASQIRLDALRSQRAGPCPDVHAPTQRRAHKICKTRQAAKYATPTLWTRVAQHDKPQHYAKPTFWARVARALSAPNTPTAPSAKRGCLVGSRLVATLRRVAQNQPRRRATQ